MDMQPAPLSGEWADWPTCASVLAEAGATEDDGDAADILDAYESGFAEGYWSEVLRTAAAVVS